MANVSEILPYLVVAPSLAYSLGSLWCCARYFDRKKRVADHYPPVTILKPVKGLDADSPANFATFCCQDYPEFQLVFAVASADDPVVPVIRELMARFPAVDIELVIDGRTYGPNYKVCNLINSWPAAKHDIIIVCDSDIRVGDHYLKEVCSLFADPAVGLVTSLYRSTGVQGFASAVEALGFSVEMVPNVLTAMELEGLSFALGASMAVRREVLESIGGFTALVDYLADDYQLGNRVLREGHRLELSDYFVECVMHRETLATVLSRQIRWCRTMRVSRPGGYLASGITQPALAALLALSVGGRAGIAAVAMLYAVRMAVALIYSRSYVADHLLPKYLWLLPLRDLLSLATWVLAFTGNRVTWRGHRYLVRPGGRMEEVV
jgi:ceramide glucosyltransferase